MSPKNKKELVAELQEIISSGVFDITQKHKGTGAPGTFLEELLGFDATNKDIPDIEGWEIKFVSPGTGLISLFSKEPLDKGIIEKLVDKYGIKTDGVKKFYHDVDQKSPYFNLDINEELVILNEKNGELKVTWLKDDLLNSIISKLRRLVLVFGNYKKKSNKVIYKNAQLCEDFSSAKFFKLLAEGDIKIEFRAKQKSPTNKKLRNHGTAFRIKKEDVYNLYKNIKEIKPK